MRRSTYILIVFAALPFLMACKSKPVPVSGEIDPTEGIEAIADSTDSISQAWGQPAPPPVVNGDGSSLFQERYKAAYGVEPEQFEMVDEPQNYTAPRPDYSLDDYGPIYSSPAYRTFTPTPTTDYESEFNFESEPNTDVKMDKLPSAANRQEKLDFVKDFFEDFFKNNGMRVNESDLTPACRKFLNAKGNDIGELNIAYFFHTDSGHNLKEPSEVQKTLDITPIDDDWYRVSMNEGHGTRSFDVKVVEMNGKMQIDFVRNKNL